MHDKGSMMTKYSKIKVLESDWFSGDDVRV